jgi:thymidine phosphorylase
MLAQEIIRIKRDGGSLRPAHVDAFVAGLVDGSWSEGQAAAMAMAVFLKGLSKDETVALTLAMKDSGEVLAWPAADWHGPVLDKHSTGGVGDKVSLMLAPILAACGALVPMISGRGLGHTGGTLDKFDSIPGYQTAPTPDTLRRALRAAGCAIIGQTAELAPADRRLYAIRDVTATVESIPLITASILSKKLAAGLQGLVMDVKCGNGAFADTPEMALALARSLVDVANGAGLPTRALVTDMNQVLGHAAGNALEVLEAVAFLRGEHQAPRLLQVTRLLCAEALQIGRLAADEAAALARVDAVLADGSALEHFARMVAALGGPADFCERPAQHLPAAPVQCEVPALQSGWVQSKATRDLGLAVVELGGGRRRASDRIDHRVGFSDVVSLGQRVERGQPLARVHAADAAGAAAAVARLQACIRIGAAAPPPAPLLIARLPEHPVHIEGAP